MPPKHQAFVFTENNYDDVTMDRIKDFKWAKYILFGKEIAPTTGTPHLQGFIWTHEPKTKQQVVRLAKLNFVGVPGKEKGPTYWEGYCSKDDVDPYRSGIPPTEEEFIAQLPKGQGVRSDLLNVKHAIDSGERVDSLMESDEHFGAVAVHHKFFNHYQAAKRRRKEFSKPRVVVIFGPTGTNKTRRAFESDSIDEIYKWDPQQATSNAVWFDGYSGQRTVIFDEFRGQLKFSTMLTLLDGYPTKVPVKGSTVDWSPTTIYITSPVHPTAWYPNLADVEGRMDQLFRRIDEVVHSEE